MTGIHRARLAMAVGAVGSLLLAVFWFPLGVLMHQRGELHQLTAELTSVGGRNATLRAEVRSLGSNSTVAELAHSRYGLVGKGQSAYVILPAAGSSVGAPALENRPIPESDLVAGDVTTAPATPPPSAHAAGFWTRFAERLEFWRRSD